MLDVGERGELAADDHLARTRPRSSSAVATVPTSAPSRRTVTRSVISRTSSRSCETKRTLAPSAADARGRARTAARRPRAAGTTVGSSSTSTPWPRPSRADLLDRAHDREQRALDRLQVADDGARVDAQAVAREQSRAPARALARQRDAASASATTRCRPTRRFSSTLSDSTRPRSWCTKLRPSSRNWPGGERQRAPPRRRSRARPASGAWKPARILISVDLPEPFSPRRPWTSPGSTLRSTPRSALRAAEALRRARGSLEAAAARRHASTATSGPRASGSRSRTSCRSRP